VLESVGNTRATVVPAEFEQLFSSAYKKATEFRGHYCIFKNSSPEARKVARMSLRVYHKLRRAREKYAECPRAKEDSPPSRSGQTRGDSKMNATTGSVGVPSDVDLAHGHRGVLR
jgi:hypothetical protein